MDAALGATGTRSDTYERIMAAIGEPGSDSALSTLATGSRPTLMSATASPQSTTKLTDAVDGGEGPRRGAEPGRRRERRGSAPRRTPRSAGRSTRSTTRCTAIDDINKKIATLAPKGVDVTGLQDERNRLIDGISSIIPVKAVKRDGDQVAIYAAERRGAARRPGLRAGFTPAPNVVTAGHDARAPPLGGLTQDQGAATGPVAIAAGSGAGLFDGGSLGALFEVRDTHRAGVRRRDRPLRQRPDRAVPRPDAGDRRSTPRARASSSTAAPGGITGLAGRIAVNAAVDPGEAGGAVWRLRDGLSARDARASRATARTCRR